MKADMSRERHEIYFRKAFVSYRKGSAWVFFISLQGMNTNNSAMRLLERCIGHVNVRSLVLVLAVNYPINNGWNSLTSRCCLKVADSSNVYHDTL